MSCNDKDGTFPLTKEECEIICNLCGERVAEMKVNLKGVDFHKFYKISMIKAKMEAYIIIMNSKMFNKQEDQIERSN